MLKVKVAYEADIKHSNHLALSKQAYKGELILGDWAYFCQLALGEKLQIPRVTFSNVPVVDPVHTTWDRSTGRRMNIPNILAYVPQIGTGLSSPMVGPPTYNFSFSSLMANRTGQLHSLSRNSIWGPLGLYGPSLAIQTRSTSTNTSYVLPAVHNAPIYLFNFLYIFSLAVLLYRLTEPMDCAGPLGPCRQLGVIWSHPVCGLLHFPPDSLQASGVMPPFMLVTKPWLHM
jgi:hypothetical protein